MATKKEKDTIEKAPKEKAIQKEIARRNKIFNEKTNQEKRILVAKDVLALIKSKVIVPRTSVWVQPVYKDAFYEMLETVEDAREKVSAQNAFIGGDIEKCECCGLGSMFLSSTLFSGKDSCADLEFTIIGSEIKDGVKFSNGLNTIFSNEQLGLIEVAFEKGEGSFNVHTGFVEDEDYDSATRFGARYKSDKNRLIAIMENIIKNKGSFLPKASKSKK